MTVGAKDEPVNDPADRQVFAFSSEVWDELQEILNRPMTANPKIAAPLSEPSILDPE